MGVGMIKKLLESLYCICFGILLTGIHALHAGQTTNQNSLPCEAILYKILQTKKPKSELYDKLIKSMTTLTNPCDNDFKQAVQRFEWSAQDFRQEIGKQALKTNTQEQSIEQANTISSLTTKKITAILGCSAHANNLILFKKLLHITYHQLHQALETKNYALAYDAFFDIFLPNNEEAVTWLFCLEKYLQEKNCNLLDNELYFDIICFFDDESSMQYLQNKQSETQPFIKPALFYPATKIQKQLLYGFNNYKLRTIELTSESQDKQAKKIELTLTSYIEKNNKKEEK